MAYVTLSDLKAELGIGNSNDDVLLADMLSQVQALIDLTTGRTFEAAADTTRTFDARGKYIRGSVLRLPYDLAAVTTITNGDSVEVASNEYATRTHPEDPQPAPFYAIELLPSSGKSWTYDTDWQDAISIEGRWAYSVTAPDPIQRAVIEWVMFVYKQKDIDYPEVTVIDQGVEVKPHTMPDRVREILDRYKRER